MRFCYAHRRFTLYPDSLDSWDLQPSSYTDAFLKKVADMGFDGLEVGFEVIDKAGGDEAGVKEFGKRLSGSGAPIVAIRSGGTLTAPRYAEDNQERLRRAIRYAGWLGAEVVNGALSVPSRRRGEGGAATGFPTSRNASREASPSEYDALARVFQKHCDLARDGGVTLSVEVHQNSPIDNSWSALLLHKMVDRPNFGINPDLGNILWTYDVPEEDTDDAIGAMAPVSVYWHCKNLMRVYHPEKERSVFLRVPLQDGEIDYRFAISAMADANYSGYMAIEGAWKGDQFYADSRSLEYARGIWAEFEH